jgi:hypothetical protein
MERRTQWLVFTMTAGALLSGAWVGCGTASPPDAPTLDAVPILTNRNPLTLTGLAEPSAQVLVRGGAGNPVDAIAGPDGRFRVEATLHADVENVLLVSQSVGGVEGMTRTVRVRHDGVAPSPPSLDPVASPTRRLTHRLRGTTEPNATVLVTGGIEDASIGADESGRFELNVTLAESGAAVEHTLAVVARDVAGNVSEPTILAIVYDPTIALEAPSLDPFAGFTSASTITLTGLAEPGVGLRAIGGTDAIATADDEGRFEVTVGLRPNQRNEVLVFATRGADTSAPSTAVIVHDDRAPETPNLDPQPSPTGATRIALTGEAEPLTTIVVTGAASAASGTVDEAGRFAIDVDLRADDTHELSVIARDAAGNASEPALLTLVQDSTLEMPISIEPVMSPTRDPGVRLRGHATPVVAIEITGGAESVTVTSDDAGQFEALVALRTNARNELRVTRPGSGIETIVVVVHDDLAPDAPTVHEVPSPTGNRTITVSGMSEPFARVSVSGGTSPVATTAGMDGGFAVDVAIAADAETMLSVIATDRAGNSSSPSRLTVRHSSSVPAAPRVDEPSPRPTSAAMLVITGRVPSPGAAIDVIVRGGASEARADTDASSGAFRIEVPLRANTLNELAVLSVEGAIESPPTLVNVVHDSLPPDPADTARITVRGGTCIAGVPTGGTASGSMGSVEARATVRVENVTRASNATTTATDGGSFSVGIPTCAGHVIRIRLTDAAGNASTPVEVTAM